MPPPAVHYESEGELSYGASRTSVRDLRPRGRGKIDDRQTARGASSGCRAFRILHHARAASRRDRCVHYHFVTDEQFDELVRKGAFYEWALVHQNRYGTLKSTVQEQLAQGHDLILEIDVQGCLQAMEQDSEVTGIFVSPPSRENLEKRPARARHGKRGIAEYPPAQRRPRGRTGLPLRLHRHPRGLGRSSDALRPRHRTGVRHHPGRAAPRPSTTCAFSTPLRRR